MVKRILVLLHILLFVFSVAVCVSAEDVLDADKTGTLYVSFEYDGKPVAGGSLNLYKVADLIDGQFVLNERFSDSDVSLENLHSSAAAKALAEFADKNEYSGVIGEIGLSGSITFSDLEVGLYLVVQYQAASGYYAIQPFLISIPNHVHGEYEYSVDASPKVDLKQTEPNETSEPSETTDPSGTTEPSESTEPTVPKLPQTGQLQWPVTVLVISGMSLMLIGFCLRRGQNTDEYEI